MLCEDSNCACNDDAEYHDAEYEDDGPMYAEEDDYDYCEAQESEPEPAPRTASTLLVVTVVLFVAAFIVQCCLEQRCHTEGHSRIYCALTN